MTVSNLKNQNLAYLGINSLKFYSLFLLYVKVEGSRKILKLRCRPLAFTSNNAFLKNKKRSGTNIPASFSARLLKKDQISLSFTLLLEILDSMCIIIVCFPGCDVINFKTNLSFLIKPCFHMTKNVRTKI